MGSKKQTPFVVWEDRPGELYIRGKYTGIHPLVLMIDGISFVVEKGKSVPHYKVDDIIAWHKKELAESQGRSGDAKVLEALEEAMQKFRDGKTKDA